MKDNGDGRLIKVAKVGKRESGGKKGYRKWENLLYKG